MPKTKVLTVKFDITHLPEHVAKQLEAALAAQGELSVERSDAAQDYIDHYQADLLSSSVDIV